MATADNKTYIGLSFGTSNSVIAIINKENRAEVIANEDGEHKTPSYIAFSGEEEYHGSQAKHQFVRNAQNTILGFRDLLGKAFSDAPVSAEGAKIVNQDGTAVYEVTTVNEEGEESTLRLSAHDATVRYLVRLRTSAEDYLGHKITGAVLAVPVWFTEQQKESVRAACTAAELPVLQLISEPAAAALMYGLGADASHDDAKDALALVVDVGGAGADVSLVAVHGGLFTVVGSKHTADVSGSTLDDVLVKHFAGEFKKQTGIDVLDGKHARSVRKLTEAAEITKRTLSAATTAPCAVESLADGMDFNGTINRTRFDILAGRVYNPLLDAVRDVVAEAGYTPAQVSQVVFCGGAARIRKLQSKVALLFPETTEIREEVGELDEVIAAGCAEQAALIAQGVIEVDAKEAAVPVLAKPIGLQLSADELIAVLQKDTPLPASRTVKVALPAGEKRAYLAVAEGEPVAPKDEDEEDEESEEEKKAQPLYRPSKLLAEMVLELEAADADTRVEVKFFVGTDRKLTVVATEPKSGKSIQAEIPQN
ncbi:Hsp70 protein that interacts with Zuo1p [Linderina macrospora]|uniref:Hsp70 protein that interacts with Zuo1p n=1 Tax=Linderina macrospora TaxID=4868 RepID=A0ACC1JHI7_9FUNG|nr:Hsp70 protein that interacts with Zuo1p [Linderina macrospora]